MDETRCTEAAAELGLIWSGTDTAKRYYPSGCHSHRGGAAQTVYLNPHLLGEEDPGSTPICAYRAGPPPRVSCVYITLHSQRRVRVAHTHLRCISWRKTY